MTERQGDVRPPVPGDGREPPETVVHKATRECPIVQPHPRESCGIVRARRRNQAAGDAAV